MTDDLEAPDTGDGEKSAAEPAGEVFTATEAGRLLGIPSAKVTHYIRELRLDIARDKNSLRISRADLELLRTYHRNRVDGPRFREAQEAQEFSVAVKESGDGPPAASGRDLAELSHESGEARSELETGRACANGLGGGPAEEQSGALSPGEPHFGGSHHHEVVVSVGSFEAGDVLARVLVRYGGLDQEMSYSARAPASRACSCSMARASRAILWRSVRGIPR